MKYQAMSFVALLALVVGSVGALTVDDAVQLARDHNLGLATEDLKVAQKADEKNFSFNRFYPSVSASATTLRLNNLNYSSWEALWPLINNGNVESWSDVESSMTEDNHWNLALGVNVQFVISPAAFRGIAQTMVDYKNSVLSRDAAAARLERDVRKAFYQLLALHQATEVLTSQVQVAEERYRLAKENFDAGLGSELAMLQAEVSYQNRRPALVDQKLNEENAQAAFRMLLNLPANEPLSLEGTLEVSSTDRTTATQIQTDALVAGHLNGRWDVASAQGSVDSLRNLAVLQSDTLLPNLIVGWSADPTVNSPFKNDRWKTWSNYQQTSGSFMLGLNWKLDGLLPGSTTGIQIAGLRRQAEQAQLGVQQTLRAGETEIRALAGKLKKSAGSLDSLALSLSLAERSSKLTDSAYKVGNSSFTDAQDADLQWQTARLQYLNEELNFLSTLADLDYALGTSREAWFHG